jgi:RHS repeat-associated protein
VYNSGSVQLGQCTTRHPQEIKIHKGLVTSQSFFDFWHCTYHLGNVLSTISDKKFGVPLNDSLTSYYTPDIINSNDYYPFGMLSRIAGTSYRYGFNGQEMSNEVKGYGNSYTAEYWEYDPRIGRRWNIDPVIKEWESPYAAFHNNAIKFNDPSGDDPPAKPGFWTKFWRGLNHEYYKTRAENYAKDHGINEENIIKLEHEWVIIDDKNSKDVRYSIFRQARSDKYVMFSTSEKNDDINLSKSDLLKTTIMGEGVIDAPLPIGGGPFKGIVAFGGKSKYAIVGVVDKATKGLQNFQKFIRFGVTGHPDVLKKGFHLHFDDIASQLELGLRPLDGGKIGFIQVGKLSIGTANDIKKAILVFNEAMQNTKFRSELLVRLKTAQEYLQKSFKFTRDSQLAVDKAHELNYIIKAVENF